MLNDADAHEAAPRAAPYKLAAGRGVHLHVSPTGFKSWRVKFRAGGKERLIVLGSFPSMNVSGAREAAEVARSSDRARKQPEKAARALPLHLRLIDRLLSTPSADPRSVYFVQADTGAVKIGVSSDVPRRLAKLQCANAGRLQLLATMVGGYAVEFAVHSLFADDRIDGEWFRPSERLLEFIEERACP